MSDEKILETLVKKVDGLADDVRTNSYKLDRLENGISRVEEKVNKVEEKLDGVSSDLKLLSRQFTDVGGMAIKDNGRIDDLEKRVDVLEAGIL